MSRKNPELAYRESIADLWGYPEAKYPKHPSTDTLFKVISAEAQACLSRTDWEKGYAG